MKRYFGTDGIRGVANKDLTPELAFRVGKIFGFLLQLNNALPSGRKRVLMGKDTRISCGMLEAALSSGFAAQGIDVVQAEVLPTPAVAYLTRSMDFVAGAMISASHNPAEDNGIKFFSHEGYKFPDSVEREIESLLDEYDRTSFPSITGPEVGNISKDTFLVENYFKYLLKIEPLSLNGLKVVLDVANGATYQLAPKLFQQLGAQVITLFNAPDGLNINRECGSTHLENLKKAVLQHKADVGLAFDGDGDRMLAVDEKGGLVDGDQIMLIVAQELHRKNSLKNNLVIATVMSNFGFEEALDHNNIKMRRTSVGDRYVLEEMIKSGANLGGEQSGHIIFLDQNTAGDGLITAIKLLAALMSRKEPLSVLAEQMKRYPQILVNVPVHDKKNWDQRPVISEAIEKAQVELKGQGRLLIRASGTEPLIRVMVEGKDSEYIHTMAHELASVIRAELN